VLALLVFVSPSFAALAAPTLTGPAASVTVNALPTFTWTGVSGADHYVFQLGGSTGFNPPQYTATTKNTRVALTSALANGLYNWRVAAVSTTGVQGTWSTIRSFTEDWSDQPQPQSPADGSTLTYPQPMLLNWTAVRGAQEYQLSIASDPLMSTVVAGSPITTTASAYSIPSRLTDGQYWWQVTPVDAEGNQGTPSSVFSFNWSWPNTTALTLNDLDPSSQVFDPQFSWTAIPGAAYYKVDVNTDPNFPSGSNVCCTGFTVATSLAPTILLPAANSYYWRVTPYDSSQQAGTPTVYSGTPSTFTANYDTGPGAVSNLSMRDDEDSPITWTSAGVDTTDPIVSWDTVPGAAAYEVQVSPYSVTGQGPACDWSTKDWDVTTVSTSWTPLGQGNSGNDPWPNPQSLSTDGTALSVGGQYCVRVRAERNQDTANHVVSGSWTDLGDDTDPSFNFTGYSTGSACQACTSGYLGAADYGLPHGQVSSGMPLLTWKPITGYQSYYVVVATDATFQNVIDYAWTQTPAYAPRTGNQVVDYPDATYYWAVLPAQGFTGTGVVARPDHAPAETFQKQSAAPTLTAPANAASISTWPVFQWTPVPGAWAYHVQVATDANFSNLVDSKTVAETSYTADSTYPAGQKLYWRVQAEGEAPGTAVGLAWSTAGNFTKTLPSPSFSTPTTFVNATTGDSIPVWHWNPVPGAVSYDVTLNCPQGMSCTSGNGLDTTAVAMTHLTGTKSFTWEVRAEFPTVQNGTPSVTVPGAYTSLQPFQRTIAAPTALVTSTGGLHNFSMSWAPKLGAKTYRFEVSTTPAQNADGSFAAPIEGFNTDTTSAAPTMQYDYTTYQNGGALYWHVAAVDADGNQGAFSATQTLTLPLKLSLSISSGGIVHKTAATVTVTITNGSGNLISGVTVKVAGAGIKAQAVKTGAKGKATFRVKPTKKGKLTFTATKTGCTTVTGTTAVY
jgi:hypothetical protein